MKTDEQNEREAGQVTIEKLKKGVESIRGAEMPLDDLRVVLDACFEGLPSEEAQDFLEWLSGVGFEHAGREDVAVLVEDARGGVVNIDEDGLGGDVKNLIHRDRHIKALFNGRGTPEVGPDGKQLGKTSGDYDLSLLLALQNKGVADRSALATALWHRPDGAAKQLGREYIVERVAKAVKMVRKFVDARATVLFDQTNVRVDRVVILASDPPSFDFYFKGSTRPMRLTAAELYSHAKFSVRYLAHMHQMARVSRKEWANHVDAWLAKAEKEELPVEANAREWLLIRMIRKVENLGVGESVEDVERGLCVLRNGRRFFSADGVGTALRQDEAVDFPPPSHEVSKLLHDLGCESGTVSIGGVKKFGWTAPDTWPEHLAGSGADDVDAEEDSSDDEDVFMDFP